MSETHLPACIKSNERVTRACQAATSITEVLGAVMLAVSVYEMGDGVWDVAQLNMEAAERSGMAAGVCVTGAAAFWTLGMTVVPRIRNAFIDRYHRRTDCAWDDWQTDGKSQDT